MHKTLQDFVEILKKNEELIIIEEYVSPELEISEITDRISKQPNGGKAIFFKNNGTKFPVLTNSMGSDKRISLALNTESLSDISNHIQELFTTIITPPKSIKRRINFLKKLYSLKKIFPKYIKKGNCQDVIQKEVNLNELPILKTWPLDAERFITLPIVHTKDPVTGIRNVGMYRMQVLSSNTTAMHWHKHKVGARHFEEYKKIGKKMPVAVVLGGDPIYTYVATAPLPDNIDEYLLAGYLRQSPVKLVKCLTQDIFVPADADFVLEGYIDPEEEFVLEGPFGDHTGFYSEADYYPIFHITCITHKKNAIFPATIVGIPPQEDYYFAKATQTIFLPLIQKTLIPEIVDFDLPMQGVAHNYLLVKIENKFEGAPQKVMNAIWGNGQLSFTKFIFVTDSQKILTNYFELIKETIEFFDPRKDIYFNYGPMDVLEHASEKFTYGSKICFDLTIKNKNKTNTNILETRINIKEIKNFYLNINNFRDFLDLKIPICIFSIEKKEEIKKIIIKLIEKFDFSAYKIVIFVDNNFILEDINTIAWLIGSNTAPIRDIFVADSKTYNNYLLCIDATSKNKKIDNFERNWPEIVKMDDNTILKVDKIFSKLGYTKIGSPSKKFN